MPVSRRRATIQSREPKGFHTKYFVNINHNHIIPVCQKAFLSILQVTRARIDFVTRSFAETGNASVEKRDGDHTSQKFKTKNESVVSFISSLTCSELHYCRLKTGRKYLPSELNISKLHKMYNEKRVEDESLLVKECYF